MRFFGCHRWDNDRNIMEVTYAHQHASGARYGEKRAIR